MKKINKSTTSKTVDAYLNALPDDVRNTLEKVRTAIKAAQPKAEEVISYQIPTFKFNGPIAAFAAFTNHCSYYTMSHSVMETLKQELDGYDTSGVTIRFPVGKPLSFTLIKKLVQAKIKENERRLLSKSLNKNAKAGASKKQKVLK